MAHRQSISASLIDVVLPGSFALSGSAPSSIVLSALAEAPTSMSRVLVEDGPEGSVREHAIDSLNRE